MRISSTGWKDPACDTTLAGRRPRSCHQTPERCLLFQGVCSGARHLRVNSPSWGALTAAYLRNSSKITLILFSAGTAGVLSLP